MIDRVILNCVVLICTLGIPAAPCLSATAQTDLPGNAADSQRLYLAAKHLLAPIELKTRGYVPDASDPAATADQLRQACLMLEAAAELDKTNVTALRELFTLYISDAINDPGRAYQCLVQYNSLNSSDVGAIENWLAYRLNSFNDRQSRENFLLSQLPQLSSLPSVHSKTLTQLGILAMEKGIIEGKQGARTYFETAFSVWPNNADAADRLLSLGIPQPQSNDQTPAETLERQKKALVQQYQYYAILRWRARIQNNPYNFDAIYRLIDSLENMGYYAAAADYYPFAYKLIDAAGPESSLRGELRFRQMLNLYARKDYASCLSLSQNILKTNPDDLLTTVAQAKTLKKQNLDSASAQAFQRASDIAAAALADPVASINAEKASALAWYFCFIQPDPTRAMELTQAAGEKSTPGSFSQSLSAYARILAGNFDAAEELLKNSNDNDPVTVLAQAEILLKKQQNATAAREKIKAVAASRWGLLDDVAAGFEATALPTTTGTQSPTTHNNAPAADNTAPTTDIAAPSPTDTADSQTSPDAGSTTGNSAASPEHPPLPPDTGAPDAGSDPILAAVKNQFPNNDDLKLPAAPEKSIHCSLRLGADSFHYDDPIDAKIYLSNIGTTNIILGPGNAVDPHLLITATVVPLQQGRPVANSSDAGAALPILYRYISDKSSLSPGRAIILKESLNIGPLRDLLQSHPQQGYQITVQLILDPIPDGQGGYRGKIAAVQPAPIVIVRQGFVPTASAMRFQLETLDRAGTDSKIRTLRLLAGLLSEKQSADAGKIAYPLRPIDADRIWGGISNCLSSPDYRLQAWAACNLRGLTIPSDPPIIQQLTLLLEAPQWFVRFLAIQTLAPIADLQDYLTWAKDQPQHPLIARHIQWLQGKPWLPIEIPAEQAPATKK